MKDFRSVRQKKTKATQKAANLKCFITTLLDLRTFL